MYHPEITSGWGHWTRKSTLDGYYAMMRVSMSKQLAMVIGMVSTAGFMVNELRVRFDVISRIFFVELCRLV